jgi:hypothetical protein
MLPTEGERLAWRATSQQVHAVRQSGIIDATGVTLDHRPTCPDLQRVGVDPQSFTRVPVELDKGSAGEARLVDTERQATGTSEQIH